MSTYAETREKTRIAIEAKGRRITLYKANREAADPAQPWRGPSMADEPSEGEEGATVSPIAVFVPARGTSFGRDASDRPREQLKDVEQFALIADGSLPDGTDLEVFDTVQDGAQTWRIAFVGKLQPGDTGLLWEVGLKR